jgi:hypothetical protein
VVSFLDVHPEFNVSKICRIALEQTIKTYSSGANIKEENIAQNLSNQLQETELNNLKEQNRKMRKLLRTICIRSAPFNNLNIDDPVEKELATQKDNESTQIREPLSNVHKLEDVFTQIEQQQLPDPPESRCSACNDTADTNCSNCNVPLCWECWSGDFEVGKDPTELCPACAKKYKKTKVNPSDYL